jgi:hypothetical protein
MKYLKLFEEFNFKNLFKSKEQKLREETFGNKDLSKNESDDSKIMIDSEPYDKSQFGQNKYGVYIENNDTHYYIGDIREFTKAKGPTPYMSYLDIERYVEKQPTGVLCHPNNEQMKIIDEELNKSYLSPNLMDETITFREYLKEKGIL